MAKKINDGLTPQERYTKKNIKPYAFRLNKKYDADIIEKLDSVDNKTGYFKKLVRDDLARQAKEKGE